ncbi:hypothetical protein [uncultured Sphingomonas sp.]|uniref:hypothetical protein n=1 Tax=uncultured Sphingomonas sp. TaxID=158754 RepID=UPI0025DF6722|nr:hypothetical protein [uncultured Sphingomonas sp.]
MAAFAILFLTLPLLLLAIAIFGAWLEGRRSPYSFGMGRVLSNAFSAIGGAPLALLAASALLNAPIQLLLPMLLRNGTDVTRVESVAASMAPFGLLWLLVYPFVTLFMARVALDTLAGQPVDMGGALRMALRRMLPALAVVILLGIGLIVGFLFLIVPGIFLMLTWFIVIPVMAAEGQRVFGCFGRSAQLLRGMRWRLLLLLIIVGVLWMIASGVVQGVGLALFGNSGNLWGLSILQALVSTIVGVLGATGTAAIYHEARTAKEGSGNHDLEAVFA